MDVTETRPRAFPAMPEDTRRTVLVVLAWILMVLGLVMLLGCQPGQTKPLTYADTITAAEELVITAANTLADAADAGIVSREDPRYEDAKEAIIEASDMIRFAWSAYLDGNQNEAEQWRKAVLQLHGQLRPLLVELTEAPQ